MADNYTVSVIVAIYNVSKYLDRCILSITEQSISKLQIILVNDGSTDDSLDKCLEWQKKNPRIEVINKENGGVSTARNMGIEAAKGKWICFVDGDDYLEKDAIRNMLERKDDSDVLLANYYVDNGDNVREERFLYRTDRVIFTSELARRELIKNCFVRSDMAYPHSITLIGVPWAKLYRTQLIKENNIRFDEKLKKMQDAIFNLEVFWKADKIIYCGDQHVYYYVQNDQSVTHKANPRYRETVDDFMRAFRDKINEYQLKDMEEVYNAKKFMLALSCIKFIYLLDKDEYTIRERLNGTEKLLMEMNLDIKHENKFMSYLGKAHKLAYKLYKMKAYSMIYCMSDMYLKYKNAKG